MAEKITSLSFAASSFRLETNKRVLQSCAFATAAKTPKGVQQSTYGKPSKPTNSRRHPKKNGTRLSAHSRQQFVKPAAYHMQLATFAAGKFSFVLLFFSSSSLYLCSLQNVSLTISKFSSMALGQCQLSAMFGEKTLEAKEAK